MRTEIAKWLALSGLLCSLGFAAHADSDAEFAQAKALYEQRGPVDQTQTLSIVDDLMSKTTGQRLYDVETLGAAAAWLQAKTKISGKSEQTAMYKRSLDYANKAVQLNPSLSTGYMWRAFNLGEISLLEGKLLAVFRGHARQMESDLLTAMSKVTPAGLPGESDDDYGPVRVLGKYYINLSIIPGNYKKGMALLKKAYEHKKHAFNYIFYAEGLAKRAATKELAIQVLKEFLATEPSQFSKASLAELDISIATAKDLLNQIEHSDMNADEAAE